MKDFEKIILGQTNCFLLKAADGYLLIDCGNAGDERAMLSALQKFELSPFSIRYLLLTHHHSDHCGLINYLLSLNPDIDIIMNEKCAEYLSVGKNHIMPKEHYASVPLQYVFNLYGKFSSNLSPTFPPYQIRSRDILTYDAPYDLLSLTGINGFLLPTPGHTPDSVSLVMGDNAFVGDAARNLLNFCGAAYEPICQYDKTACYESWDKFISLGVKHLHPSHGPSFDINILNRKRHNII